MAHYSAHNAVYFDFDYFMTSALEVATNRANRLASLDALQRTVRQHTTISLSNPIPPDPTSLSNLLSHVSEIFQVIIGLIRCVGVIATYAIIAILVAVPMWFLSTALTSFFAGSPPLTVVCVAVLGIGFVATIRKLGQEQDILVAFRHEAQELSTAYDCVKFNDKNEFLMATETPGCFDLCQDVQERFLNKRREIDKLHERAKERFTDILIDVVANRADKLPGFERVNEIQLRDYLRRALHEIQE
ncbi:hypothetical protein BYT27DRAFT_7235928 [Phlegmacium glaucopus]|nr:hypothetical protein BYT27DRAFT_7235928 [Phlegmacium glaucopus]